MWRGWGLARGQDGSVRSEGVALTPGSWESSWEASTRAVPPLTLHRALSGPRLLSVHRRAPPCAQRVGLTLKAEDAGRGIQRVGLSAQGHAVTQRPPWASQRTLRCLHGHICHHRHTDRGPGPRTDRQMGRHAEITLCLVQNGRSVIICSFIGLNVSAFESNVKSLTPSTGLGLDKLFPCLPPLLSFPFFLFEHLLWTWPCWGCRAGKGRWATRLHTRRV